MKLVEMARKISVEKSFQYLNVFLIIYGAISIYLNLKTGLGLSKEILVPAASFLFLYYSAKTSNRFVLFLGYSLNIYFLYTLLNSSLRLDMLSLASWGAPYFLLVLSLGVGLILSAFRVKPYLFSVLWLSLLVMTISYGLPVLRVEFLHISNMPLILERYFTFHLFMLFIGIFISYLETSKYRAAIQTAQGKFRYNG
ncbi:hypothetical protein [Mesobacillus jeotgali]|uniref:hypothetical protein n=1 Tax=Mesobacillus jeotgali TaxID=129985 RepID=UPI001CFC625C|nr:hypothetical protein [Mesobacillus jeotgali]